MEQALIKQYYPFITNLIKLPEKKVWSDYDKEADVLYVSFGKPQKANDTVPTDTGILIRKKGEKIIGLTILNASRFLKQ
jgi:uncharacterized protein YuzE